MVRKIIKYPAPSLRNPCEQIEGVPDLGEHIQDLKDTLSSIPIGVALASNQILERGYRVFVVRPGTKLPEVVINPRWRPYFGEDRSSEIIRIDEGCLSIPEIYTPVSRQSVVHLTHDGGEGVYDGLEARIIQHECEHLDGRLIADYLTHNQLARLKMEAIRNRKSGR